MSQVHSCKQAGLDRIRVLPREICLVSLKRKRRGSRVEREFPVGIGGIASASVVAAR